MVKPAKKKVEYHFNGLEDAPRKVKFRRLPNGFRITTPAPNFGKAAGTLIPILIAGFVAVYGPDAEKTDPFMPRLVCGIIMGIFFLGGVYQLLRRHELFVSGNDFRLSSGIGILGFRQKEKLSNIKSMWVQGKLRTGPHATSYVIVAGSFEQDEARYRTHYLGIGFKDKSSIHSLEGASQPALQYIAYALQTAIRNLK